jgi:hypothetical protein
MERAFDFVVAHGDALAVARARALVDEATNREVLPLLGEAPDTTDLPACERALWLCMDLRLLASPFARALGRALASVQGEEGAWRAPGADDDEVVRCTGMLAGCLARSPFVRPETLEAAGDFLAAHWDPDRVSNGRLADLRAHALFFANALHDRADEGDGSFGVAGEARGRVEPTLDGLHALRRFQPASAR